MRQAITTTFHGPTNHHGARITARAEAGMATIEWDHRLSIEKNHEAAAFKLVTELGWRGRWVGGGLPGAGYVFVNADDDDGFSIPHKTGS